MVMPSDARATDLDRDQPVLSAFLADEPGSAHALHDLVRPAVAGAVGHFLESDHKDGEDVVQDTILAVFDYLRKRRAFNGNIRSFAAAVARNRCRDILRFNQRHPQRSIESLHEWMSDGTMSALDFLADEERRSFVRKAVTALDFKCRRLLDTLYYDEASVEEVRQQLGLKSVQLVYYRRDICLRKVLKELKRHLSDGALFL